MATDLTEEGGRVYSRREIAQHFDGLGRQKRSYTTHAEATAFYHHLRANHREGFNDVPTRAYKCVYCGWFHLGRISRHKIRLREKRRQMMQFHESALAIELGERATALLRIQNGSLKWTMLDRLLKRAEEKAKYRA